MTVTVRPRARDTTTGRWVVCVAGIHDVRPDGVACPMQHRRVSIEACLTCHRLVAISDEREGWTACAVGDRD